MVLGLVVSLVLTACSPTPPPVAPAHDSRCLPSGTGTPCTAAPPGVSGAELARPLLAQRVLAWADGSRSRWLSGLAGSSLRAEQGRVFDRMTELRVGKLTLASVTADTAAVPVVPVTLATRVATNAQPSDSTRPGATAAVIARFAYRLTGFDTADRTFEVRLSVRPAAGPGEAALITAWSPHGRPELWDVSGLHVRRDANALVVSAGPPARAEALAARARHAGVQVQHVWGSTRPTVWVAPATNADAARLLGRDPADARALRSVSAVTDGPLRPGQTAGADRVVVVPEAWASLTERGRQVVTTHELTHVVVRATTTGPVPLWLSEGVAELVAYREVRLPERVVVAPALQSLQTGAAASRGLALPPDTDFSPGAARYRAAYGWSLLAVRQIVADHGQAGLVRFYRAVAGTPASTGGTTSEAARAPQSLDDALASVLGTDQAELTRETRNRAKRLLS